MTSRIAPGMSAAISSLQASGEAPPEVGMFRRVLYPIAALSALLAFYSVGRAIYVAVTVLLQFYPRFAI